MTSIKSTIFETAEAIHTKKRSYPYIIGSCLCNLNESVFDGLRQAYFSLHLESKKIRRNLLARNAL